MLITNNHFWLYMLFTVIDNRLPRKRNLNSKIDNPAEQIESQKMSFSTITISCSSTLLRHWSQYHCKEKAKTWIRLQWRKSSYECRLLYVRTLYFRFFTVWTLMDFWAGGINAVILTIRILIQLNENLFSDTVFSPFGEACVHTLHGS